MEMNNDNIHDSISSIQNNVNYNFFSKVQDDDDFNINPYDDLNVLCQYSNLGEIIEKMKKWKGMKIVSWLVGVALVSPASFIFLSHGENHSFGSLDIHFGSLTLSTLSSGMSTPSDAPFITRFRQGGSGGCG